ncbi:unnamed protein product [Rangifer tarandus platyrhynchus]|uniref:Uncharacterized protein n=2 Tax=Rangifer tarandus platyrhynchus TaxID=3082113 RepID=A0ACB0FKD2_RANTA|nr:unnamed protein product [Rangifer tarandus platyrhynchus]CAI9713552.1 unnamed protein product [Rangifer tarandus platyrhynchus]
MPGQGRSPPYMGAARGQAARAAFPGDAAHRLREPPPPLLGSTLFGSGASVHRTCEWPRADKASPVLKDNKLHKLAGGVQD